VTQITAEWYASESDLPTNPGGGSGLEGSGAQMAQTIFSDSQTAFLIVRGPTAAPAASVWAMGLVGAGLLTFGVWRVVRTRRV
jgi:hypothetical protein